MSEIKKEYVAPTVQRLGGAVEITRFGTAINSDVQPFQDDTAIPPPGPDGS